MPKYCVSWWQPPKLQIIIWVGACGNSSKLSQIVLFAQTDVQTVFQIVPDRCPPPSQILFGKGGVPPPPRSGTCPNNAKHNKTSWYHTMTIMSYLRTTSVLNITPAWFHLLPLILPTNAHIMIRLFLTGKGIPAWASLQERNDVIDKTWLMIGVGNWCIMRGGMSWLLLNNQLINLQLFQLCLPDTE